MHLNFDAGPYGVDKAGFIWDDALSTMLKELFMTTIGHIEALERRHQELDRKIQTEMQNRQVDDLMIASLKRKKLEVKDELFKLQTPAH